MDKEKSAQERINMLKGMFSAEHQAELKKQLAAKEGPFAPLAPPPEAARAKKGDDK